MIRSATNTYIKLKIWLKEFVQLCFFSETYKLLFWVERALTLCKKNRSDSNKYCESGIYTMPDFIIDKIFVVFRDRVFL
jgi:hypothetical protein